MFIQVAEMILAELASHITLGLEVCRDGRVLDFQPQFRARHADLGEPRPKRTLAGDKSGTPCSAALLAISVGENSTFFGNTINVRRPVSHHAAVIGADIPISNIVAPDYQNIWFIRLANSGVNQKH